LNRNHSLALAAAMLGLGLLGAGCTDNKTDENPPAGQTTTGPTPPPSSGGGQIAFVTNNASDFWVIAHKGVDKAAQELGTQVQFVMPADGTAATQKANVDDLIAKGVKAIAISPVDPTNQTTYINDISKKIKVVTQDSDAPKSDRLCYIGTDNHAAGVMAGGLLKEALPQGGKIMLFVGKRDAQNAHDREMGIRDALKGSNINILDVRTDDADHARAKQNASDALVKTSDIAALVGLWSYNGPAILSAVEDAHKVGKVKIVCFDEEEDTLAGVKAGKIYATVVQQPYQFGYQGVKLMNDIVKGDMKGIPASKQIIIPTQAIKQANVDKFKSDLDKLRGKA